MSLIWNWLDTGDWRVERGTAIYACPVLCPVIPSYPLVATLGDKTQEQVVVICLSCGLAVVQFRVKHDALSFKKDQYSIASLCKPDYFV